MTNNGKILLDLDSANAEMAHLSLWCGGHPRGHATDTRAGKWMQVARPSFTQCGGRAGEHLDVSDIQGRKGRIGKGEENIISVGRKNTVYFQEECFLPGALVSPYAWALWDRRLWLDPRDPPVEVSAAIFLTLGTWLGKLSLSLLPTCRGSWDMSSGMKCLNSSRLLLLLVFLLLPLFLSAHPFSRLYFLTLLLTVEWRVGRGDSVGHR